MTQRRAAAANRYCEARNFAVIAERLAFYGAVYEAGPQRATSSFSPFSLPSPTALRMTQPSPSRRMTAIRNMWFFALLP